jgi:DNA polymerase III epsilon subunit-like protein
MASSNDAIKNDNGQQQQEVEDNGKAQRLIWIDCEMTGLDLETHRLVEIACIITEPDLSVRSFH